MTLHFLSLGEDRRAPWGWTRGRLRPATEWPGVDQGDERGDVVIALHEAAHAVVGLHLGFPCHEVKSKPTYARSGEMQNKGVAEVPLTRWTLTDANGTPDPDRIARAVVVCLAGGAVASKFSTGRGATGTGQDTEDAVVLLKALRLAKGYDADEKFTRMVNLPHARTKTAEFVNGGYILLSQICAVANHLLYVNQHIKSEEELREIIAEECPILPRTPPKIDLGIRSVEEIRAAREQEEVKNVAAGSGDMITLPTFANGAEAKAWFYGNGGSLLPQQSHRRGRRR